MALLEIKKIKTTTPEGKWFTCEVAELRIVKGRVEVLPVSKKYQWYNILLSDCIIVK